MTHSPIFVLNAPKRTGKDTVARFMETYCTEMRTGSFKDPLFNIFLSTTGMNQDYFYRRYAEDDWKDSPNEVLNGKTPRDFLIHISEAFIKPFFGQGYFGEVLGKMIEGAEAEIGSTKPWVIPDCGFNSEVDELVKMFGSRVKVVKFTRDGYCGFGSDSRTWVDTTTVDYITETNQGDNGSHDMAVRLLREFDLLDFEPIL